MDLVTIITPIYNGEKYLKRYFSQINAIGYKDLRYSLLTMEVKIKHLKSYKNMQKKIAE